MKSNLFIIRSPLQLLNAIEARESFQCKNNTLLLIYNTNLKNSEQIDSLVIEKDWTTIIKYEIANIQKYLRLFNQINLVKSLNTTEYDYIFSGDFGTINQLILANLKSEKIYLLDDGTRTIVIHQMLKNDYFKALSFSKKMKLYRYILFGLSYKVVQEINFFTIYNLISNKNEKIHIHNFEYLTSTKLASCKKSDFVYLLGQNLVEVGVMDEKKYALYIEKIIDKYNSKIIYIPHRSETISNEIYALASENFNIQKSSGAIEVVLLNENIYPKRIISFISSALFNLNKIFANAPIDAIKLDVNDLKSKVEIINKAYSFFDKTSISIVKLDEGKK